MITDITYMCYIVNFTNFYSKASLLENTLTEILINPVKWSFRIPEKMKNNSWRIQDSFIHIYLERTSSKWEHGQS